MRLESLKLRGFRNYHRLDLDFPDGVVLFTGDNGQGKTNLMEAVHLLLRGESFRPAHFENLKNHDWRHDQISLRASVLQKGLRHELDMSLTPGRKNVSWNGRRVQSPALARMFPLVLFSPESLAAIKSGPEQRRQLLDDLLMTHSAASVKVLKDFRRALKARNRLLRDLREGHTPKRVGLAVLESLDPSFLPLATELTVDRLKALDDMRADLERTAKSVLIAPAVDISVEYLISGVDARTWARTDILSALHKRALELRDREMEAGTSLVGPHKHDVRFLFAGKDSRFFCSQGQQRALILSFKMAQILYHQRAHQVHPFLLLDDVLSELDPARRSSLVTFLKDIPAQIFLTATDLSFSREFGPNRLSVFHVENGHVGVARDF